MSTAPVDSDTPNAEPNPDSRDRAVTSRADDAMNQQVPAPQDRPSPARAHIALVPEPASEPEAASVPEPASVREAASVPEIPLGPESPPTSEPSAGEPGRPGRPALESGGPTNSTLSPADASPRHGGWHWVPSLRRHKDDSHRDHHDTQVPAPAPETAGETVADARAALAAADSEAYFRSLAGLVRAGHGELLRGMEYSPELAIHQADVVHLDPAPENTATLHLYGQAAYRNFDKHLTAAFSDPQIDHLLANVHHALVHGNANIALITNHGEIIDIALVLGALTIAMCEEPRTYGVLGETIGLDELADRSNLLVSKMVATTEVFGIPTAEVLSRFCRTYFSVPQTASRRRAKLDPELAKATNLVMRAELHDRLERGGQLLSMAASGSQDLSLAANVVKRLRSTWRQRRGEEPDDAPSLHLQPLYSGTMKLMLECRYVLPVAVSMNPAHPICEIGGLTRVRTEDDCHGIMEWIAATHEAKTGVNTVYHHTEDDLLSQVRAFR